VHQKVLRELQPSAAGTKSALSRNQVETLRNCTSDIGIVDLLQLADRSDRTKYRNQVINPLIGSGLLEMTIPDKPTSSKQEYRLTEEGKQILKNLNGK